MKILTVRQPWASLILLDCADRKDIENCEWSTLMRGRVGIHASGKLDMREYRAAEELIRERKIGVELLPPDRYPVGAILGTVNVAGCVLHSPSPWFVGRYGFLMEDPKLLASPIPVKGMLGFWNYQLKEVA